MRRLICQATSAATTSAAPPATMKYPQLGPEVPDVAGEQNGQRAVERGIVQRARPLGARDSKSTGAAAYTRLPCTARGRLAGLERRQVDVAPR